MLDMYYLYLKCSPVWSECSTTCNLSTCDRRGGDIRHDVHPFNPGRDPPSAPAPDDSFHPKLGEA